MIRRKTKILHLEWDPKRQVTDYCGEAYVFLFLLEEGDRWGVARHVGVSNRRGRETWSVYSRETGMPALVFLLSHDGGLGYFVHDLDGGERAAWAACRVLLEESPGSDQISPQIRGRAVRAALAEAP